MDASEPAPRRAGPRDVATVTELLTAAFHEDPTWSWPFPDPDARWQQHRALFGLWVAGALSFGWTWLTDGDTATSVWVPPGGRDLGEEQERALEALLGELPPKVAARVGEALRLFEESRPRGVPHYYLSMLATDPRHRGRGVGLGLLAENLRVIDEEGAPAYLEASNPANVPLYERYGFRHVGSFAVPNGGPEVVRMWRDPSGGG